MRVGTPLESTPVRDDQPWEVLAIANSSGPRTRVVCLPGWVIWWVSARISMMITFAARHVVVSMPPMLSRSSVTVPDVIDATSTSSLSSWS